MILTVDKRFDPAVFDGASCAFGVFDGVHKGHQFLLSQAKRTAVQDGGRSLALTFDIDPDEIFHPARLKKLMSNPDRLEALAASGVDAVVAFKFDRAFASKEPMDFLYQAFQGHAPSFLHVGDDFRFGTRDSGDVEDLVTWSVGSGTRVCAHRLVSEDGRPITATRVRGLLAHGRVREARELLGHPYTVHQKVEHGRGQGAELGFRTANLNIPDMMKPIADGVYAAYAVVDGRRYRAAVSVGVSPTFKEQAHDNCEVHVLGFDRDIYGSDIRVEFVEWLRPMIEFDTEEELVRTVEGNISWVKDNLPL